MPMDDFLFRGNLANLDPDVAALVELEALRQVRKLIMIPSESTIPEAVREAVGSVLGNIYAEGYPPEAWRKMPESTLLDTDVRLAEFRRNSSPRYYKGTEVAEIVESLARRRTAERFATDTLSADDLYVNVQPLSGAPANSAVYTALTEPGDTIMGLNLIEGGHLTHGSPVNRSGKFFNVLWYGVDETERLNYDQIRELALEHHPKFIIGGFTSYPWSPDWNILREIADEAGSMILADVSHVAGLIIAGEYPSPVGIADIVSFTTHKTLHGPRGAVLLTHRKDLYKQLDRAVFPGEQGGPHVNSIAGLAVAMKLAATEQFHDLQKQIVINARVMAEQFKARGIRVAYDGTDTHMVLIDVGKIKGDNGIPLSGDIAARVLDIAGVTANRNTIPGDKSPFRATGVRFGTTWITQRGFREAETRQLTDAIADLMLAAQPYPLAVPGKSIPTWRAKFDYEIFADAQYRIARLAQQAGIDMAVPSLAAYPKEADAAEEHFRVRIEDDDYSTEWEAIHVYGDVAPQFLDAVLTSDVLSLSYGDAQPTFILSSDGQPMSWAVVERMTDTVYMIYVEQNLDAVIHWLTALSDGYVQFDVDIYAKIPGAVSVSPSPDAPALNRFDDIDFDADWWAEGIGIDHSKPFFIGAKALSPQGEALPEFAWEEPTDAALKTTPLYDLHKDLDAKMAPFAGYDMPLWYDSVGAEHNAVRDSAGIFDVTHMGVFECRGAGAMNFLNVVTANDVTRIKVGGAHYSYLLGTDGIPLDDIYIYRVAEQTYMIVVNASNNDKNWAWLQAIHAGTVQIDPDRPWATAPQRDQVTLRDLRDYAHGDDCRVDIALQGKASKKLLLDLLDDASKAAVQSLGWSQCVNVTLDGAPAVVSRTGYTGERIAYELFVHPDRAATVFKKLVDAGATPCGLAARDSLRTEAGLPLYGHELEGDLSMTPADAGFGAYVKLWKPFFVGKAAYLEREAKRDTITVRFTMDGKGLRPVPGDPIVDGRGRVIGQVTSCVVDAAGEVVGLALVKDKYRKVGTPLSIYVQAAKRKKTKSPAELQLGDKTDAPQPATVLTRFPSKKK